MSLNLIHSRVADSAVMFLGILAVWALFQRLRSRPLDGNWYGAALLAEILLLVQFGLGWVLYFQGFDALLPRPFMHILYGVVAVITALGTMRPAAGAIPPSPCCRMRKPRAPASVTVVQLTRTEPVSARCTSTYASVTGKVLSGSR